MKENYENDDLFSWTDDWSVGVSQADFQHRQFIHLINEAYHALTVPREIGTMRDVVDGLLDYAKVHFACEEKLFEEYAYPDAASHRREHESFLASAKEFKETLLSGETQTNVSVCLFMKNWLVRHIASSDKKYAEYFRSKNLLSKINS